MKTIILIFLTFFSISNSTAQVGALDNTFGVNGNAVHICSPDYHDAASIQLSDNSYILLGNQFSHYTVDGNLDLTYGVNGFNTLMIPNFGGIPKLQADGKIMMAGVSTSVSVSGTCALGRSDIYGSPDPNFGTNGVSVFSGLQRFDFMDISPDQTIVSAAVSNNHTFKVYKALPNGSPDTSFGLNGIVVSTVHPSGTDFYSLGGLNVQQDGKIVISGYVYQSDIGGNIINYGMFLMRYLTDGSLDPVFGTNGLSINSDYPFYETVQTIQPDGKIVIAGVSNYHSITIMRFLPNGNIDSNFGNNGIKTDTLTSQIDLSNTLEINKILLQPDGKIVLVGGSINTDQFLIARYTTAGVLDPSFNNTGFNLLQINNLSFSHYLNVYLQPDLKLVAIGNGYNSSTNLYSTVFSRFNSGLLEAEGFSMSELSVSPNPVLNVLSVNNESTVQYELFTILGAKILAGSLAIHGQLDCSNLAKGMYLLKLNGDNGESKVVKVVKE